MSFRDDRQLAAVCNVLTRRVRSKGIAWGVEGPSEVARAFVDQVEAGNVWRQVYTSLRDSRMVAVADMLEQDTAALEVDPDLGVLKVWCLDSFTLERIARRDDLLPHLERAGVQKLNLTLEWNHRLGFSSGERLMCLVAWSFWNGRGEVALRDVAMGSLDGENLRMIGTLITAIGEGSPATIDAWLKEQEARHG
jgi:hypothetical protein